MCEMFFSLTAKLTDLRVFYVHRTNVESMEKKFFALNVMSDVHKAINVMRSKSALRAETEEEKKARFSEECSWYEYSRFAFSFL